MIKWNKHFRLPFDWKSPFRYLIVLMLESVTAFYTCLLMSALLCSFIGSCCMLKAIVKDITIDLSLRTIENQIIQEKYSKSTKSVINRIEAKVNFCDIIQFHSDAKKLSRFFTILNEILIVLITFRCVREFSGIFEFVIAGLFVWTTLSICSSLLVLQVDWFMIKFRE